MNIESTMKLIAVFTLDIPGERCRAARGNHLVYYP